MGTREDYQAVMETQSNQWKAQTERVKPGSRRWGRRPRPSTRKISRLQAKQEEAWENFHKLTNASDGGPWEQFRANMDKASGELKAAGERITKQFRV